MSSILRSWVFNPIFTDKLEELEKSLSHGRLSPKKNQTTGVVRKDLNENIEDAKNLGKLELESTSSFQKEELEKPENTTGVLKNLNVFFGYFSNSEIIKFEENKTMNMDVLKR